MAYVYLPVFGFGFGKRHVDAVCVCVCCNVWCELLKWFYRYCDTDGIFFISQLRNEFMILQLAAYCWVR